MTNTEAINWIINISADIGKAEHRALWHYEQALDEIREMLESAQPEPQWIPVSERLPERCGNYLVSIEGEEPDIGTINPNDPRGWSLCDANGFYWASDKMLNVTAWKPLPTPYTEDNT